MEWFSLMPKESNGYINQNPFLQIASQIHYTYARIENMKSNFGDFIWDVRYDDICHRPRKFLESLKEKSKTLEINLGSIDYTHVPESFKKSSYALNGNTTELAEKFKEAFQIVEDS